MHICPSFAVQSLYTSNASAWLPVYFHDKSSKYCIQQTIVYFENIINKTINQHYYSKSKFQLKRETLPFRASETSGCETVNTPVRPWPRRTVHLVPGRLQAAHCSWEVLEEGRSRMGKRQRINSPRPQACVCVCVLCRLHICTCVLQCVVCAIKTWQLLIIVIIQNGAKQNTIFIEQRLSNFKRTKSFWEPEKRNLCATFNTSWSQRI